MPFSRIDKLANEQNKQFKQAESEQKQQTERLKQVESKLDSALEQLKIINKRLIEVPTTVEYKEIAAQSIEATKSEYYNILELLKKNNDLLKVENG